MTSSGLMQPHAANTSRNVTNLVVNEAAHRLYGADKSNKGRVPLPFDTDKLDCVEAAPASDQPVALYAALMLTQKHWPATGASRPLQFLETLSAEVAMKILWLTLADPFPPTNGQYLYSYGLIRSIAKAGAELHVVGFGRPGSAHRDGQIDGNVRWSLADHRPQPKLFGILSALPHISHRTRTDGFRKRLNAALDGPAPDAVVFDSISIG